VTPDPLDQLSARLFESARSEVVPRDGEQRALEAARRELSRKPAKVARISAGGKWLAAVACVALAAGAALLLRPRDTGLGIRAEPAVSAHARHEPRNAPNAAPRATSEVISSDAPPNAPSIAVTVKPTPSIAPAAGHSAPASLSDELSALKVASSALSAGDPKAALAALDRYDRVLKGQKLRAEATLLKIEALSRGGQTQAASTLAQRFVDQNPGNPLVDRARSFVVK
jgi:hypothetical protein